MENCKKIVDILKSTMKDKKFWIFTAIVMIFFGVLINVEYAVDTYAVFSENIKKVICINFLSSGRFITAIFSAIAIKLKISEYNIYIYSFIMAIVSLILSLYILEKIIYKDVKKDSLSIIITTLRVLNAFIIELFLFIEKGILIFSILMSVISLKYLIKYFENKEKKELFKVLFFMFISIGSYQGTVGLFIALALPYILKYSKNFKEFIKNNLITAVAYIIPAILDLFVTKIFNSTRVSGKVVILDTIKKILSGIESMFQTYLVMPKNVFLIFFIIIIISIIYKILINKKENKYKILDIFKVIYIIAGTILVAVMPQLIQDTNSIFMVPRSTFTFASLCGILLLYLFMNYSFKENRVINLKNVLIILSILYLLIQFKSFSKIEISRYELNTIDKNISLQIINEINNYEKSTGNIIKNIAVYKDKNPNYNCGDIVPIGDMNIRAYYADWGIKGIVNYYLGRYLNLVNSDENIQKKFDLEDWNDFNINQLIFDNDTLNICVY